MSTKEEVRDLLLGTWRGRLGIAVIAITIFVADLRASPRSSA